MDDNNISEKEIIKYDIAPIDIVSEPYFPPIAWPEKKKSRKKRVWLIITFSILIAALAVYAFAANFSISTADDGISIRRRTQKNAENGNEVLENTDQKNGGAISIRSSEGMNKCTLNQIYKKNIDSVVTITAEDSGGVNIASGIIFSEDGYIITNSHVIGRDASIAVLLNDDREFSAVLVGSDSISDIAVLKIEAQGLAAAQFGDSDELEVGDSVAAIGTHLGTGLRGTLTDGIVSGLGRLVDVEGNTLSAIQTNTALNAGSSGGPLINAYGQVVGINTTKGFADSGYVEGVGFAIPISEARPVIDELMKNGYVSGRPAIGIIVAQFDYPLSVAQFYGIPQGVVVEGVDIESDAFKKGIMRGDIITAANGERIISREDLTEVKNSLAVGDVLELKIFRSGEYLNISVVLTEEKQDLQ